jgi:hypothetical protein
MMEELRGLGFDPSQMLPVHHPLTKVPMPLFFLDLKPSPNNIKIYELTRLYRGVIKVEPPKPKRTIVQNVNNLDTQKIIAFKRPDVSNVMVATRQKGA